MFFRFFVAVSFFFNFQRETASVVCDSACATSAMATASDSIRAATARARRILEEHFGTEMASVTNWSKGCDQVVLQCLLSDGRVLVFKEPRREFDKVEKEVLCCTVCARRGIAAPRVLYHDNYCLVQECLPGHDVEKILKSVVHNFTEGNGASCGRHSLRKPTVGVRAEDGEANITADLVGVYKCLGKQMAVLHQQSMPWFGEHISSNPSVVVVSPRFGSNSNNSNVDIDSSGSNADAVATIPSDAELDPCAMLQAGLATVKKKKQFKTMQEYVLSGGSVDLAKFSRHPAISPEDLRQIRDFLLRFRPSTWADCCAGSAVLLHYDIGASNIMATFDEIQQRARPTNTAQDVGVREGAAAGPSADQLSLVFSGLIDFGDAGCGAPEEDFAVLFAECYGTLLWDAVLQGYRSVSTPSCGVVGTVFYAACLVLHNG